MKTLLRVFGVILVLVALVVSSLGVVRNFRDAEDAAEYENTMSQGNLEIKELKAQAELLTGESKAAALDSIKQAEDILKDIPSKNTFTFIGVLMVVLVLTSLVSAVLLFVVREKAAKIILAITIVSALIAIVISPNIGGGLTGGASNRTVAMIAAVPAFLSALFAFLISRMKPSNKLA